MSRKYLIETHGCQMNVHDSERMAGLLEQAGYEPTRDDGDADVIVINTCSVRERAEEKLFTRLGELRQQGLERVVRPVVAVAGCVAQQEGQAILKRSSSVDVIIGTQNIKRLPVLVEQASARRSSTRAANSAISEIPGPDVDVIENARLMSRHLPAARLHVEAGGHLCLLTRARALAPLVHQVLTEGAPAEESPFARFVRSPAS